MDLDVIDFLQKAVSSGASDMFIIAGLPASIRINGNIVHLNDTKLLPADTENIILQIYNLAGNRNIETLELTGDDDFSFAVPGFVSVLINSVVHFQLLCVSLHSNCLIQKF